MTTPLSGNKLLYSASVFMQAYRIFPLSYFRRLTLHKSSAKAFVGVEQSKNFVSVLYAFEYLRKLKRTQQTTEAFTSPSSNCFYESESHRNESKSDAQRHEFKSESSKSGLESSQLCCKPDLYCKQQISRL